MTTWVLTRKERGSHWKILRRDGMALMTSYINKVMQSSMWTMGCRRKSGNRETSWGDLAMDHASTDGD